MTAAIATTPGSESLTEPVEDTVSAAGSIVAPLHGPATLLAWLHLATTGCLLGWVLVATLALGWTPTVVSGDSMEPSIRSGDVALTASESGPFEVGVVVVFDQGAGRVIHRIVEVESDGSYRTRGDANVSADGQSVSPDQIVGTGRLLVPFVGLPVHWARTGAVVPALLWSLTVGCSLALVLSDRRRRS